MKRLLPVALVAAGIVNGSPVAHASCHLTEPWNPRCWTTAFTARAGVNCFGCGVSSGAADIWFAPAVQGVTSPNAKATYTVTEIPGQCPVTGSATGSVTGVANLSFSWARVGAVAVISTTGDVNGGGTATFAVTSPVGSPCGGSVTAQVVGAIAGV